MTEPKFKFHKDLIEYQTANRGETPYILHEDTVILFKGCNSATRRAANGIVAQGGKSGKRQISKHRMAMTENGGGTLGNGEASMTFQILEKS
jgi:hypothetical protein